MFKLKEGLLCSIQTGTHTRHSKQEINEAYISFIHTIMCQGGQIYMRETCKAVPDFTRT